MAFSLPTGYLSASQINKYLSCPKQYEQEYVLGLRSSGGSVASTTGSCVHLLVENNLKKFIAGVPELSDITLATLSDTTLADMFKEVGDLEGESEMFWVSEAQKLFKTWYKELGHSIVPLKSEFKIEKEIAGVPIVGYVDYTDIQKGYEQICDLKVVSKSKSESDAKNSVQLAIYALALDNPNVRFDSVVKTKVPKTSQVEYTFSKSELGYFTDLIGEVATNISLGRFPMTDPTNWVCTEKWCSAYKNCRGKERD
jgi:RecB family exonuclease